MNDKLKPSQESHRDRASNHEKPASGTTDYSNHRPATGTRDAPATISERDPLPTKPPTRKDE